MHSTRDPRIAQVSVHAGQILWIVCEYRHITYISYQYYLYSDIRTLRGCHILIFFSPAMLAMLRQFLCNRPISVSYAYKKETKGERLDTGRPIYTQCINMVSIINIILYKHLNIWICNMWQVCVYLYQPEFSNNMLSIEGSAQLCSIPNVLQQLVAFLSCTRKTGHAKLALFLEPVWSRASPSERLQPDRPSTTPCNILQRFERRKDIIESLKIKHMRTDIQ